jgi:integrase
LGLYRDTRTGWWVAAYKDATGRRRRVRVSRIEREARKSLALLDGQSIQDRLLHVRPLKSIGFDGFARIYLDHAKTNVKAWSRYASSLGSLTPFFGNMDLTAVAPDEIERYKKARIEDVEPGTVNRDLQVLRRMFNLAIAWGYARESPVRFVKFFRESKGRIRYLTREEFGRVLEACPEYLRPIVIVAVHTGLRLGELLALLWGDVDLENGFLSVNDPKNAVPAKVPLNQTAHQTLRELFGRATSVRVFTGPDGTPVPMRTVERHFKEALVRAKIQGCCFHTLRHTAASWLVMAGVDIRKVKDVLRHADVRTTLRYVHLAPEDIADAVRKLDEFARSKPGTRGQASGG